MIHRMTPASNPRLFLFYTLLVAFPAAGLSAFSYLPPLAGAAAFAVGAFFSYRLYRFAVPYLGTRITTDEAGVTFTLPGEGDVTFPWKEVSLSGKCTSARGKPFVFAYHAGRDRLISIPYEYTDMKGLETELAEKTPFETFHFLPGMNLRGILQERFPTKQ